MSYTSRTFPSETEHFLSEQQWELLRLLLGNSARPEPLKQIANPDSEALWLIQQLIPGISEKARMNIPERIKFRNNLVSYMKNQNKDNLSVLRESYSTLAIPDEKLRRYVCYSKCINPCVIKPILSIAIYLNYHELASDLLCSAMIDEADIITRIKDSKIYRIFKILSGSEVGIDDMALCLSSETIKSEMNTYEKLFGSKKLFSEIYLINSRNSQSDSAPTATMAVKRDTRILGPLIFVWLLILSLIQVLIIYLLIKNMY